MRLKNMIYFSRRRLEAFFPDRAPRRMPAVSAAVDLRVVKLDVTPPAPRSPTESELLRLAQVRREIERNAAHWYAPGVAPGEWIFFDLRMGWSTTHGDSALPDLDDVLVFFGSLTGEQLPSGEPADLMLCGSTEHLLRRTATAGRMGSGTGWLHRLILKIDQADRAGVTDLPDELTEKALSVPRVNRPSEVCRWVFDVIAKHHAPEHRGRVQGLAQVNLSIPGKKHVPGLVVATPLYVHDATRRPLRWLTRVRLHLDLCRRYNRSLWSWRPSLPPRDRQRYYEPASEGRQLPGLSMQLVARSDGDDEPNVDSTHLN